MFTLAAIGRAAAFAAVAATTTLAVSAANATVTSTVSGLTTTYAENFNNGSSSFTGALRDVQGADDYLWLRSSAPTSSYTFTGLAAVSAFTLGFNFLASPGTTVSDGAPAGRFRFTGPGNTTILSGDLRGLVPTVGPNFAVNLLLAAFEANVVNPGAPVGRPFNAVITAGNGNFAAGDYTLSFEYTARSGVKIDDVQLSATAVTAVPEPATYALMLAGLGLVAGVARRKKAGQLEQAHQLA